MKKEERKKHWENIYQTKKFNEVSWFQAVPTLSLSFLKEFNIASDDAIVDVGGGDSFLPDYLLKLGYTDISVVDISEAAIERAKTRLGKDANKIQWILEDAATFEPNRIYDFWHDRAAFHFFTEEKEILHYLDTVQKHLTQKGIFVLGTFSESGPTKCSGIEIKQYSENTMAEQLKKCFEKIKCVSEDHKTPFETIQNFVFCSFRKLQFQN